MTALRQAAEMALEVLENLQGGCTDSDDGTVEAITVWCPEIIDALREALAQPEQEQIPEGWQLVPVEATDEMIDAAWDSDAADYIGEHKRIHSAGDAYIAMLAAAPKLDDV